MLNVSNAFKNHIFNTTSIQWEYTVNISNVRTFTNEEIKSINISGELQKEFTIGSSLSKSLEIELLISEKTPIPENSSIEVIATLVISDNERESVNLGTFYTTDVDRKTIGKLKITAVDAMGHTDKLDSYVDMIFPDTATTVKQIVSLIAKGLSLGFNPSDGSLYNHTIGTFNTIIADFTYRQLLEYLAGFCGCNVRITNDQCIEFFRFRDTGITLTKANYYNMSKGQYLFKPNAMACSLGDSNTLLLGEGKASSTIKFTNPYMTKEQLSVLYAIYCSGSERVEYYAINANIIGTGIFEPGDIVTIIDHYNEPQKIYIQDYKLSCFNGVKETLDSYFDYNKGSISNSISGQITKLNNTIEQTKQYVSENFVSNNEFEITIKDLNTNIEYANDGLNKWSIEYYRLEADYDSEGKILDRDYDLLAINGKYFERSEIIDDGPVLASSRLFDDSHTLCRFFTGAYVKTENNDLFVDVQVKTSDGVNVYINGGNTIRRANSETVYTVTLQAGWNTIEIITGAKPQELTAIAISFKLKYEKAPEGTVDPFYHITSTMTQAEKDMEDNKEENLPDEAQEEIDEEELEVLYKRFNFIRIVNTYLIDINYKRVTEVERLTTADSIIDRVSKSEFSDEETGESISGVDLLLKESTVVQEVDKITQTITDYEKTLESTEEKISEVTQTVDNFKLSFTTALYGNYFSNSAFATDDPLIGFNYSTPNAKDKRDHVFTLRTDMVDKTITVDKHDIANYGHTIDTIPAYNEGSFEGVVNSDDKNAYHSSSRTLSMGKAFKLGQTFFKEDENFPYYKNNDTGDYYQFYISLKAKRGNSCFYKNNNKYYVFPRLSISLIIDHEPVGDNGVTRTIINNLQGQPSKNEGVLEYGSNIDLDVLPRLGDYEIDTEWKQIEYFIDFPKELMDSIEVKSFSVSFETQYWTSVSKNYILIDAEGTKTINDVEKIVGAIVDSNIYIAEPMFGTTRDYIPLNYTSKKSELITGVTNITQDGIEISRSDSELTTEIRNSGMAILYDGEMVAQFKEKTIIPELEVTKKLTAPNMFFNTTDIPDTIYIGEEFANDEDCGKGPTKELCPKYVYFNHLNQSLDRYGIVQLDKLTIIIKKNVDEKGNVKKVFPDNTTGTDTPNCFMLDNLKCGTIEIKLEEGVVLSHPIVIKNIDGTVKVRGPINKTWITINTEYIIGSEGNDPAPIVPNIIAHNVRWIEIWGLNFTGGKDFPVFDHQPGEYTDETLFPGETFKSYGELYTKKFDKLIFPFTSLYAHSKLEELNDIINKVAIFIGYCWCGDVSRCNFPSTSKSNTYFAGSSNYTIGVYGDHCDCYLFNNQGILGKYYLNRDKCWFRLPVAGNGVFQPQEDGNVDINKGTPDEESNIIPPWGGDSTPNSGVDPQLPSIIGGSGTSYVDLMGGIWPGGMIRKGKISGTAYEHCYLGTSRDLAYLGSFLHENAPTGTFDPAISTPGSNLAGYSRIKQGITLKGLKTLYDNTEGYFFGASPSLPSVSYSPNDTSVATYSGLANQRHTSLLNGLGFSITMPDIAKALGENRELRGAKLRLEFETINGKLVEYGNQYAFDSANAISTYGGGVTASNNRGVAFGIRFVYDESHYDSDGEMLKGYYNMGRCRRAHEILASGRAINSWASSSSGSATINSMKNFSHSGGEYGIATPFIVGLNPFTNDGKLTTEMEIDLGQVTTEWFDSDYVSKYSGSNTYMSGANGLVDADAFFNTLKGLSTSSIKYIDVAPVGIWDSMREDTEYPSMEYYPHFSYDINGDQNAYIGLATSCFKLKEAQLILDIVNVEEEYIPSVYTLTVNYVSSGGVVLRTYSQDFTENTKYDVTDMINGASFDGYEYDRTEGETSGTMMDDVTITVYYKGIPIDVEYLAPSTFAPLSYDNSGIITKVEANNTSDFTNHHLYIGGLESTNTNNTSGYFRTIDGNWASNGYMTDYLGSADFYSHGKIHTGIQLSFDNVSALPDNVDITSAKLSLKFSGTQYGSVSDYTYFYVRLLFGGLHQNKTVGGEIEGLNWSNYTVEIDNLNKEVYTQYHGRYWRRYESLGDIASYNPFMILNSDRTFTINLANIKIATDSEYAEDIQYTYDTYHSTRNFEIKPEEFKDISTLLKKGKLSAIQIIPLFRSDVNSTYHNLYTSKKLLSAKLTITTKNK